MLSFAIKPPTQAPPLYLARVMSAKNFGECADECLGWAKTAESDKARRSYLQMAETWLEAAALYEKARPSPKRTEAFDRPPPPHDSPP